jgi:hypothetical protein
LYEKAVPVTVPLGVDGGTFPCAPGQLIPILVFEQRLGHYDGSFLDRGHRGLIEDKNGDIEVDRLLWDRLVRKP